MWPWTTKEIEELRWSWRNGQEILKRMKIEDEEGRVKSDERE